jgi:uncharacterized protein YdeI (YjbR/CyaY-like superfamily)
MTVEEHPLEFEDRDQWRAWLEENHANAAEAWLVIYKVKYKHHGLALDEAVEQALCFGWIDGTLKTMDDRRYRLRFSPRKPSSVWSISNIDRVKELIASGKMTPAGYQTIQAAKERGEWEAALRREQVDKIPQDLEAALRKVEGALAAYRSLPGSRKKRYIYWLQTAKREATAQRRIQAIIQEIMGK